MSGPVGQRQAGDEARAVEVGVDADLEVDRGAFGFEAQRRVDFVIVADLGAPDHLVEGALRRGRGRPPSRSRRRRRCLRDTSAARRSAASTRNYRRSTPDAPGSASACRAKKLAPEGVALVPHVHGRDVGELVVGQGEEALARREGLHRLRQRRDVEQHGVVRRRARRGIAIVAEVLEQDVGPVPRLPAELLLVAVERILDRPGDIGRQIGLDRVEIEQREVLGLERRQVDAAGARRDPLGASARLRRSRAVYPARRSAPRRSSSAAAAAAGRRALRICSSGRTDEQCGHASPDYSAVTPAGLFHRPRRQTLLAIVPATLRPEGRLECARLQSRRERRVERQRLEVGVAERLNDRALAAKLASNCGCCASLAKAFGFAVIAANAWRSDGHRRHHIGVDPAIRCHAPSPAR